MTSKRTKMAKFPERPIEEGHPSQDESFRFAVDSMLRKHGYSIFSREKNKEAYWMKHGFAMTETDALCNIPEMDLADAEYKESLYWEEKYGPYFN
jgi:hypothetical protein